MTSGNVNHFPPITFSTAYDLQDEIKQYLKEGGILLTGYNDLEKLLIEKQPVDLTCRATTYNNNINHNNNNNNNNNKHNNNNNNYHHHHHHHHHHHDIAMKKCRRKNDHSLLKFLALNALELSAPASDVLLRQHSPPQPQLQQPWIQLSGHPDSFAPAGRGTIWKKCTDETEAIVYEALSQEFDLRDIVPRFLREVQYNGETFIELQDLLHNFNDPNVMDIKMGTRTFLESEVQNTFAREDLYLKMIAVDPSAPTSEENEAKKVTKLRYMQFREEQSSTSTLGFRIEAMKFRGSKPVTDLKKVKSIDEVSNTLSLFLSNRDDIKQGLVARLMEFRTKLEQSQYFKTHEVVGSSILIIYDDIKVGAWLIDFAKTRPVPQNTWLTHRLPWFPGNHEEGFLYGLDQLIKIVGAIGIPQNAMTGPATASVILTS